MRCRGATAMLDPPWTWIIYLSRHRAAKPCSHGEEEESWRGGRVLASPSGRIRAVDISRPSREQQRRRRHNMHVALRRATAHSWLGTAAGGRAAPVPRPRSTLICCHKDDTAPAEDGICLRGSGSPRGSSPRATSHCVGAGVTDNFARIAAFTFGFNWIWNQASVLI